MASVYQKEGASVKILGSATLIATDDRASYDTGVGSFGRWRGDADSRNVLLRFSNGPADVSREPGSSV